MELTLTKFKQLLQWNKEQKQLERSLLQQFIENILTLSKKAKSESVEYLKYRQRQWERKKQHAAELEPKKKPSVLLKYRLKLLGRKKSLSVKGFF